MISRTEDEDREVQQGGAQQVRRPGRGYQKRFKVIAMEVAICVAMLLDHMDQGEGFLTKL